MQKVALLEFLLSVRTCRSVQLQTGHKLIEKHPSNIEVRKQTWASTPLQEETSEPDFPSAKRSKASLTDLRIGKTEPSPAFSRLQNMEVDKFTTMVTTKTTLDSEQQDYLQDIKKLKRSKVKDIHISQRIIVMIL